MANDRLSPARAKVEDEGACRVCGIGPARLLDFAHTWPRGMGAPGYDDPDAGVPLCSRFKGSANGCHDLYDAHALDLLPYLTLREQVRLVELAGSISAAYRMATGERDLSAPRVNGPF